jgi:hypothetical protein
MKLLHRNQPRSRRAGSCRAYSLPEVLIASGLGVFVLAALLAGGLFTLHSFVAMFNYADMDMSSCASLDGMSKEIRQASSLVAYTNSVSGAKALVFSGLDNSGNPMTLTYKFDPDAKTVTCSKQGQKDQVCLTGCTSWQFSLYDRAPSPGYVFNATTNASDCKLVELTWTCKRTIMGQFDSETVQTAQIVLRNQ